MVYLLLSRVVYPVWVAPLVGLEQRIAQAHQTLDKLEEQDARVDRAKRDYHRFVDRVGSMDVGKVENSVRARLNELIAKHRLEDSNVSPSRGTRNPKTGVESMIVSVNAVGPLESAISFLKDVAELPQLIRVGNGSISPASSSRQQKRADRVNLRIPIELLVLPQQRLLGRHFLETELTQPDGFVRHQGRDYSDIWKRTPFIEFEPLKPLVASAGRDVDVVQGQPGRFTGSAAGGDGNFTYEWDPKDGLSSINSAEVTVDTSVIVDRTYTLTVKDGAGSTPATDSVRLVVRTKPEPVVVAPAPPPPPPGPQRDPLGKQKKLAMALIRSEGESRRSEFLIHNVETNERTYVALGDQFDGGELVGVHPRGGVVRRQAEYFVYPIGTQLDQSVKADAAVNYPALQAAVEEIRQREQAAKAAESAANSGDGRQPTAAANEGGGPDEPLTVAERAEPSPAAEMNPLVPASDSGQAQPTSTGTDALAGPPAPTEVVPAAAPGDPPQQAPTTPAVGGEQPAPENTGTKAESATGEGGSADSPKAQQGTKPRKPMNSNPRPSRRNPPAPTP